MDHKITPMPAANTGILSRMVNRLPLVAAVIISGLYCCIQSFKTFSIAEGWYTVFARYINSGKIPYRDFELHFTPLYAYLIAGITRVFGYEIYVLRIVGILVFVSICVVSYLLFAKLFKPWLAAACALTTVLFMQSEPVQIFYDYIRVFDLFAYIATLFLVTQVERLARSAGEGPAAVPFRTCSAAVLSGFFAALAFLTRQNSGAFVLAYSVVLLLFAGMVFKSVRQGIRGVMAYLAAFMGPIVLLCLYLFATGSFRAFLESTGGDAIQSKGGIMTVLFAWMKIWYRHVVSNWQYLLLFLVVLAVNLFLTRCCGKSGHSRKGTTIFSFGFCAALAVGIVGCYGSMTISRRIAVYDNEPLPAIFYTVVLLVFIVALVRSGRWNRPAPSGSTPGAGAGLPLFALAGMILAIGYGSGTSAALSQGQTALAAGLILGLLVATAVHPLGRIIQIPVLLIFLFIGLNGVSLKFIQPYSWWGLTEGPARFATETTDVNLLSNIRMTRETKEGIERIVSAIEDNSGKGDEIFVFPHAPIFYAITDRYPSTYTLVQWFDVASDENVVKDIDVLKENLPEVIVDVYIPEFVTQSHETLFRGMNRKSGLRQMAEELHQIVYWNDYKQVDGFWIQEYFVAIYSRN
ncbi:MAG: hypothetical protein KBA30_02285 [Clostridia bacterium]|nr:hypothetical protein [Clostridia bacterium]